MLPYGRKNPLPFPFFEAVAGLWSAPDYLRKGVIHKRVETAGVYPLVRPRGVSADSVCFASNYPMFHVKQKKPAAQMEPLVFLKQLFHVKQLFRTQSNFSSF